jgi:hypothetical protein
MALAHVEMTKSRLFIGSLLAYRNACDYQRYTTGSPRAATRMPGVGSRNIVRRFIHREQQRRDIFYNAARFL